MAVSLLLRLQDQHRCKGRDLLAQGGSVGGAAFELVFYVARVGRRHRHEWGTVVFQRRRCQALRRSPSAKAFQSHKLHNPLIGMLVRLICCNYLAEVGIVSLLSAKFQRRWPAAVRLAQQRCCSASPGLLDAQEFASSGASAALWSPDQAACFLFFFFFFLVFSRVAPAAYRGSQARGPVAAVATGLHHSRSKARSKTH